MHTNIQNIIIHDMTWTWTWTCDTIRSTNHELRIVDSEPWVTYPIQPTIVYIVNH
jgi:hypothetical protein